MRIGILILSILLVVGGCDSFLTVRPKSDIMESDLLRTSEGVEDALYGVYAQMAREGLYGRYLTFEVPDVLAQMYNVNNQVLREMSLLHHNNDEVRHVYNVIWKEAYRAIGCVNNLINSLKQQDEFSMKYYSLYYGEALGLRAFLHFDLVRLFAPHVGTKPKERGIPYVREWTPLVTPFSTVEEVYAAVLDDLQKSKALLEKGEKIEGEGNDFTNNRQTHFNFYASCAMLARVYWMKGDLDSAGIYARKVIDSEQFDLVAPAEVSECMAQVISKKEGIWGLYNDKLTKTYREVFYNSFTIVSEEALLNPRDDYESIYAGAEGDNDLRLPGWFRVKRNDASNVARFMKLLSELNMLETKSIYPDGVKPGINLVRMPEMYLIVAEALLGKDPEIARDYFDSFIVSRGLKSFKDRGKELTLEDINNERRKEFIGEGQEFYNMKRQMRDIRLNEFGSVLEGSDDIYKLTIPDSEFEHRDDE